MKKTLLTLICSGLVLIFLLACQRRSQVGVEGKGLSGRTTAYSNSTQEEKELMHQFNDTAHTNYASEIGANYTEIINEEASQHKNIVKPVASVVLDSIYPKEFRDPRGMKAYLKMWNGVYANLESLSGREYDLAVTRIDFFDTHGQKINEFDVLKHNPYGKDKIPQIEDDNYQNYVYMSFIPRSLTSDNAEYKPQHYYSFIQLPSSHSIPVVGYHMLGAVDGKVTDWKFTAICLDEKGNVLRKIEDLDIDPYEFCLSENKKFFCVAYGGLRGENLTRLRNNGFRIYEVETGKIVYEMEVDGKHTISGPVADKSYENIFFGSLGVKLNDFGSSHDSEKIYIRIDFENRIIYRRNLTQKERDSLRWGYDRKGFIMEDPLTKRQWRLLFDKDFAIEKF